MVDGKKFDLSIICFEDCTHLFNICAELRSICDVIQVIWQHKSYSGKDLSEEDKNKVGKELSFLKRFNFVDKVILYEPPFEPKSTASIQSNEMQKRKSSYELMCALGMDYCLVVDSDEFNFKEDVINGIRMLENGNYDASYINFNEYAINEHIQLEHKNVLCNYVQRCTPDCISTFMPFGIASKDGLIVDFTRQFKTENYCVIPEKTIMHHFSFIRDNLNSKLTNYSQPSIAKVDKYDENETLINEINNAGIFTNIENQKIKTAYVNIPELDEKLEKWRMMRKLLNECFN